MLISLIIFLLYFTQLLCRRYSNILTQNNYLKIFLGEFSCSGKIITRKMPKRKNRFENSKIDEEEEEDITIYDKCQHLSGWKPRRSDLTPPPPLPVIIKNGREIK
uniref:Secreted protein n=1 Tax=Meloidogyne floridensis TaxID=298350 RepID=A0A915NNP0_9BILA